MEKLLTVREVAEKLNISKATLRRWDKSGKFKSKRHPINNYRVYSENQLESIVSELQVEYNSEFTQQDLVIPPFFETDLGKLYNYDAIKFLKTLETNSVDLIFADPPYNIKKAEWDYFSNQFEYIQWNLEWITEAKRILKNSGSIYICGFSEILADIKFTVSGMFHSCKWLVWFYRNKANLGLDWGRSHESILHLRKSNNFYFNVDEVRIPYNQHTLKYPKRNQAKSSQYSNGKSFEWEPNPLGAKPKDVLEIPTISNGAWEKFPHETQKPVELLKKIILSSSTENNIILDPFGGSGTTYAVAEAFNRRWIGCELKKNYCEIIENRLKDVNHINRIRISKDEVEAKERRKKLR